MEKEPAEVQGFFARLDPATGPRGPDGRVSMGKIAQIDAEIGRILAAYECKGWLDNTIVVFVSDHGEMLGSHGLRGKGLMFEESVRVPLIIRLPGRESGKHVKGPVSHIDLVPTLLDLMGQPVADHLQGKSLRPIVENSNTLVRDSILIEDDVPLITSKLTPIPARTRTLLTEEFKFSRNTKGEEQLFDLSNDHDEMTNIVDQSDLRARMLTSLSDAMMLADDSSRGAPSTH